MRAPSVAPPVEIERGNAKGACQECETNSHRPHRRLQSHHADEAEFERPPARERRESRKQVAQDTAPTMRKTAAQPPSPNPTKIRVRAHIG